MAQLDTLFHDLISLVRPVLFVEAGAFEAGAARRVAAAVPGCRVVAFEANPYVHDRFSRAVDYSAERVDYRHQALADKCGNISFFVVAESSSWVDDRLEGYNSLLRRSGGDWLGDVEYEEVTVPATTLDHEFTGVNGPFAMWMDVEGAARTVLSGAPAFLDKCDVVKIEVEESTFWRDQWLVDDVVAELAEHGLEPLARDAETAAQYNVLFVRRRLLARADVRDLVSR